MAGFVHQQKQDKSERELPAPHPGIDPDHQQHGPAGLQQNGKKFQERKEYKLQLREKLRDQHSNHPERRERFFHPAPGRFLGRRLVLLDWFGLKIHGFVAW